MLTIVRKIGNTWEATEKLLIVLLAPRKRIAVLESIMKSVKSVQDVQTFAKIQADRKGWTVRMSLFPVSCCSEPNPGERVGERKGGEKNGAVVRVLAYGAR